MKTSIFHDDDMQLIHDEIPLAPILLIALTSMLLISEVSIISTVLTLLVLTVQTLFGFSIIGKYPSQSNFPLPFTGTNPL